MIFVEKGYTLKGITIGDKIDGQIIVGIEDKSDSECDVAVLTDKPTIQVTMQRASEMGDRIHGLKEYKDNENVGWCCSDDIIKGEYDIERYNKDEYVNNLEVQVKELAIKEKHLEANVAELSKKNSNLEAELCGLKERLSLEELEGKNTYKTNELLKTNLNNALITIRFMSSLLEVNEQ